MPLVYRTRLYNANTLVESKVTMALHLIANAQVQTLRHQ
jgi:hypothetical protein